MTGFDEKYFVSLLSVLYMTSTARRVVADAFSDCTIESIEPQNARPGNETVCVKFIDREPVYAKVDLNAVGRIRREVAAMCHADNYSPVNVPEIIAADPDADSPYMITSPLAGELMNERWTGGDDKEVLMRMVGKTVAAVHNAQLNDIGIIGGWDSSQLQVESMSWTETLCATVRSRVESEFSDRFSELPIDLISTIESIDPDLGATLLPCFTVILVESTSIWNRTDFLTGNELWSVTLLST